MKFFLKILFFIFTLFITVEEAKNSLQEEMPVSPFQGMESIFFDFENHFEVSCLNDRNVVAYSERVRGIDIAAQFKELGYLQFTN